MKKTIYGIQGGIGSFNEQALNYFLEKNKIDKDSTEIKYLYTTENVLKALDRGNIDYGQFAMHNSVGGIVTESVRAIASYRFKIVEEFGIKIQHYLMKHKDSKLEEIDTIMTHPQVLKQCKSTLEKKYPNLTKISGEGDLIDHAMVAKAIADKQLGKNIVIMGPKILSEIYDLDIIEGNLQDDKENFTSFLMVERY